MSVIYQLEGTIQTDGDFIIDLDDLESMSKNFYGKDFSKYISECGELYFVEMKTEDSYLVRNFLEQLIRSFRIGTHIFLVKDFYEFINKILDNIFNDKSFIESHMYGNWDSYLFLNKIIKEKVNDKAKI